MGWPARNLWLAFRPNDFEACWTTSAFVLPTSVTRVFAGSAGPRPEGAPPIPVAVVEDNSTVRRNLERLINRAAGFHCVCACADGVEALRVLPGHEPRVVLMDIQMPKMSGVDCVARLKVILPSAQIIMLTVYEDTDTIFKALRAGASGYLLKRCAHDGILHAIREILEGGAPMSIAIARKVVAAFHEPVTPEHAHVVLSAREREARYELWPR